MTVLVDGHAVGELQRGEELAVAVGPEHCRLAVLPEVTFFSVTTKFSPKCCAASTSRASSSSARPTSPLRPG